MQSPLYLHGPRLGYDRPTPWLPVLSFLGQKDYECLTEDMWIHCISRNLVWIFIVEVVTVSPVAFLAALSNIVRSLLSHDDCKKVHGIVNFFPLSKTLGQSGVGPANTQRFEAAEIPRPYCSLKLLG